MLTRNVNEINVLVYKIDNQQYKNCHIVNNFFALIINDLT